MLARAIISAFLLLATTAAHSQLEFTTKRTLQFTGTDSIEGKRIVAGGYIFPLDSFNLRVDIKIMDHWKTRDSIVTKLTLDTSSLHSDRYVIIHHDTLRCYRFYNADGIELLISKEEFYEYRDQNGEHKRSFENRLAQFYLPEERKGYVGRVPLLFEKCAQHAEVRNRSEVILHNLLTTIAFSFGCAPSRHLCRSHFQPYLVGTHSHPENETLRNRQDRPRIPPV